MLRLLTVGGVTADVIRSYIETQGEKKDEYILPFSYIQTENRKSCSPKHLAAVVFYIIRCWNDKIREYEVTKKAAKYTGDV